MVMPLKFSMNRKYRSVGCSAVEALRQLERYLEHYMTREYRVIGAACIGVANQTLCFLLPSDQSRLLSGLEVYVTELDNMQEDISSQTVESTICTPPMLPSSLLKKSVSSPSTSSFSPKASRSPSSPVPTPLSKKKYSRDENPLCPLCEGKMIVRKGSSGEFWGCASFGKTKCNGTYNMKK